jgi:hypothetical protein
VFVPERLPEQSIFKDAKEWMEIFVTEGHLPEEREFKAVAVRNDLRGLQFEEVWSSD